jgi:dienelactone hydrolase
VNELLSRREVLQQFAAAAACIGFGATRSKGQTTTTPTGTTAAATQRSRLDRYNLMQFRAADGSVQPVKTIADWEKRKAEIYEGFHSIAGTLPTQDKRCKLDVKIEREVDNGDSYIERLIHYTAEPGSVVPAYMLIPKKLLDGKATAPAILSLLGTGMNRTAFSEEAVAKTGLSRWNDQRDYTRELADRGYVTITPAYPFLGVHTPDLKALGYESAVMKSIWDNIRAMDILDSLPFVSPKRKYGAIGHSLGGFGTMMTAAYDDRLEALVSSGGWGPLDDYDGGDLTTWTSIYYFPKIKGMRGADTPFDFTELTGCITPKPCFINMGNEDPYYKWQSTDRLIKAVTPVYQLYGAQPPIAEYPVAKHDFPDAVRARAYEFLDKHLKH